MPPQFFPDVIFGWVYVAVLVGLLGTAAWIDTRTAKIPNRLTVVTLALGLVFNAVRGGWMAAEDKPLWVFETGTVWLGVIDALLFAVAGFLVTFFVMMGLWILGGLQAASNLVYAAAAWSMTDAMGWTAVLAESLCAGLGTAPFVALFMISCERGLEGPQYALLSSIFAAAGALAGAFSGFGVHSLGWGPYFLLTFVVAAPAFTLLPRVKRWLDGIARACSEVKTGTFV